MSIIAAAPPGLEGDSWVLGAADPARLLGSEELPLQERLEQLSAREEHRRRSEHGGVVEEGVGLAGGDVVGREGMFLLILFWRCRSEKKTGRQKNTLGSDGFSEDVNVRNVMLTSTRAP